jgi:hypothetical protein
LASEPFADKQQAINNYTSIIYKNMATVRGPYRNTIKLYQYSSVPINSKEYRATDAIYNHFFPGKSNKPPHYHITYFTLFFNGDAPHISDYMENRTHLRHMNRLIYENTQHCALLAPQFEVSDDIKPNRFFYLKFKLVSTTHAHIKDARDFFSHVITVLANHLTQDLFSKYGYSFTTTTILKQHNDGIIASPHYKNYQFALAGRQYNLFSTEIRHQWNAHISIFNLFTILSHIKQTPTSHYRPLKGILYSIIGDKHPESHRSQQMQEKVIKYVLDHAGGIIKKWNKQLTNLTCTLAAYNTISTTIQQTNTPVREYKYRLDKHTRKSRINTRKSTKKHMNP